MTRLRGLLAALLIAALALAVGLALRGRVLGTVRVAGNSMRTTLRGGDVALVTRLDYAKAGPARGDVTELAFPGRADTYVKRVVGLPGERIAFSGGRLYVNGEAVPEPWVSSPTGDYEIALGPDEYLVLGDNRQESYDSRMPDMGPVSAAAFLGRVRWILWPPGRFGAVK